MGDQHSIDAIRLFADHLQPLRDFLPAHTGIDKQPKPLRSDERGISTAAASQDRYGYRHGSHYLRYGGQDRGLRDHDSGDDSHRNE